MATAENLDAFDALRHLVHNIKATGKRLNLGLAMEHAERVLAAGPELSRLQAAGGQGVDDAQIIAAFESAGVEFLCFRGGLSGTKNVHTTSGSQDVSKLISAVRSLLAAHPPAAPALVPLTDQEVEELRGEANRGFDIERDHYFKAFRDAEKAHGFNGLTVGGDGGEHGG